MKSVGGRRYVYFKHGRRWCYVGPLESVDVSALLSEPRGGSGGGVGGGCGWLLLVAWVVGVASLLLGLGGGVAGLVGGALLVVLAGLLVYLRVSCGWAPRLPWPALMLVVGLLVLVYSSAGVGPLVEHSVVYTGVCSVGEAVYSGGELVYEWSGLAPCRRSVVYPVSLSALVLGASLIAASRGVESTPRRLLWAWLVGLGALVVVYVAPMLAWRLYVDGVVALSLLPSALQSLLLDSVVVAAAYATLALVARGAGQRRGDNRAPAHTRG